MIISNNCYVPELGYTEIKKYWENLKILWGDCADAEPLPFGTDPKQHAPQQVVENMTIPSPRRHTPHSSNPPAPPPEHNADTEDHQQPEQPDKDQSQITAENERPREALSLRLLFLL